MRNFSLRHHFNWRVMLVRILINTLTLTLIVLIVPKIHLGPEAHPIWTLLALGLVLGVLNAVVKPIIQFFTLPFLFVTYGLVVILINTIVLWILAYLVPSHFVIDGFIWSFVAGALMGITTSFLESFFGLTVPIVLDESGELRADLDQPKPSVDRILDRAESALFYEGKADAAQGKDGS
ncbi:MAG: phage holin family protein [Chloroflexota bacterium]|nr:phage holin family protein [Chloroflexota bacterium]